MKTSNRGMTHIDASKRSQIAKRLREAGKFGGLSQGRIAEILGLNRPSVSAMEAGSRRVSVDELSRLAETFEFSVAWLLGETPNILGGQDPRLELVARELLKLSLADLERLLKLLATLRRDSTSIVEGNRR
jgi:transcriptional regulator with XRE-family HTH domain